MSKAILFNTLFPIKFILLIGFFIIYLCACSTPTTSSDNPEPKDNTKKTTKTDKTEISGSQLGLDTVSGFYMDTLSIVLLNKASNMRLLALKRAEYNYKKPDINELLNSDELKSMQKLYSDILFSIENMSSEIFQDKFSWINDPKLFAQNIFEDNLPFISILEPINELNTVLSIQSKMNNILDLINSQIDQLSSSTIYSESEYTYQGLISLYDIQAELVARKACAKLSEFENNNTARILSNCFSNWREYFQPMQSSGDVFVYSKYEGIETHVVDGAGVTTFVKGATEEGRKLWMMYSKGAGRYSKYTARIKALSSNPTGLTWDDAGKVYLKLYNYLFKGSKGPSFLKDY
jgi:hypothetical protein